MLPANCRARAAVKVQNKIHHLSLIKYCQSAWKYISNNNATQDGINCLKMTKISYSHRLSPVSCSCHEPQVALLAAPLRYVLARLGARNYDVIIVWQMLPQPQRLLLKTIINNNLLNKIWDLVLKINIKWESQLLPFLLALKVSFTSFV